MKNLNQYIIKNGIILLLCLCSSIVSVAQVSPQERQALIDLYNSTDGANWTNNTNWLTDAPVRDWYGVTAVNGKITRLSLVNNNLVGNLPNSISNLLNLTSLGLTTNKISGELPSAIGSLINLSVLNLNDNELTGILPIELGQLIVLTNLSLASNSFTGNIPVELGQLSILRILDLQNNGLIGNIPSELVNTNLQSLILNDNNLSGSIPLELSQLSNLQNLNLNRNNLNGNISNGFSLLANFNQLEIRFNSFVFSNFETEFEFYKNNLNLFAYAPQAKVDQEETLSVAENGTITLTSTALTSPNNSYQWYRDGVLISGAIDKDLVITNAKESDAGIYHFTATNSIVTDLTLERNPITLTVEENICGVSESEKQALLDLYNATNGDSWSNTLASNKPWDENISVCDWYGVTVVDGKVVGLNLENNVVSGTIPSSISNLIYLTNLDLNTNALIGEIPSSMGALLELTYLSMHHNSLTGNLPPSLGSLSNLTVMDLGFNTLQGPIPIAFCNLSNLEILNLSNNQLSGSIPKELGILKKLRRINLQYNFFTNVIPSQLISLSNLEYLALNNNILSGVIPFTATEFSRLESFLFENNKFIFSDFENKHIGYKDFINTIYQYSPQAKTDAVETKTVTTGNTITLTTVLSSENNNYQWFKGDVLIPSATSREYSITNATIEDAGDYYFKATNNVIDGLTLERNVVTLNVVNNCEVSATERQALEALYTSTNGTNWTNTLAENQSWLINDSDSAICDWYGVVVEDNKVVELNLSNNNLQGILPDIFNGLPYLKKIRFDGNILSGEIPVSFSAIAGLDILAIENNRFIFSDIETGFDNYVLKLGNEFTYIPQDMVDDENTDRVAQGESVTLTTTQLTSNANTYQWFKNGLPIDGATNKEYTITNVTAADQAVYFFEATNTIVDDLILIRRAIKVEVIEEGDTCGVSESEKQALIDLYNSTDGPNWTNNSNWLTDAPVCDWYGVTVIEGKVTELYLYNNKLSGVLPLTINQLSNLTRLALAVNRLSGNIPEELGELKELYYLHLGMNLFSGEIPAKLYQLQNLTDITLANNELSGLVSSQIGNLINLTRIDFGGNLLSGNIPSEIESLSNLRHIELNDNQFTGNIPIELGGLSNLQVLLLYNNKLEGPIPNELGLLTELNRLNLSVNLLTGEVPIEINNLNKLENFSFAFNKISGKIPLDLNALRKLIFSNNQFVFSDIEEKFDLFRSELVNNYRYFPQAKIDEIETKSIVSGQSVTLTSTDLTSTNNRYQWFKTVNGSTTEIPGATDREYTIENVAETDAGIYHFTATNSIVTDLTLTRNPITLEVLEAGACAVSDEDRQALIDFYQTTNGDAWVNTVDGSQPWLINDPTSKVCDWFGVTVSSDYKVESIQLPGNNLRGEIPTSLEVLKDLKVLDLSQNNMIGEIPVTLGNMPNLESLNLRENVLVGAIPEAITNITSLQTLDLGLNRFSSVIPTTIGELQALTYLDLSENKLEGTIPESLYTSLSLEVIKFQKNNLSGGVSVSIGDLVNLEVFWLSENNFSGAIPSSITSIPGLYSVHLDANAFGSDLPLLIPNFTLPNTEVQIDNNRFVFSDFENEHPQYRGNLTNYTYIPQAKVDRVETIIVELGGSARLFTDDLTSPNNTYRWFKGQDFFVETQLREITIDNITEADLGDYYFVATNSTIENLELTRYKITLRLEDVNPPGDDCNVLEGVADGSFESLFNVASTNSQSNSDVTSSGGWQVFSQTPDSWRTPITGNRAFISQRHPKSPDGEVFVGALGRYDLSGNGEGAIEIEGITTTINNLDIGQEYRITFYQSNGTNKILHDNITPDPDDAGNWKIVFGSETKYSDFILVENNGVWQEQSLVFTASSQQQDLSFIASAITKPANSYVHIYMLVDDIKVAKVGANCDDTTSDYEFCLSQDSPTIADLTSPITGTNMVSWYEFETGGEPLPLDEEITENFTYWADDNLGNPRVSVDVDVYGGFIGYDNLEDYDYQSFAVITDPKISDLQSPGENITWYSAAVGGIQYNDSDSLVNGSSYYAQQGTSPCRFEVSVFVGVFPPLGDGWQFFCKSTDPTLNSIELADLDAGYSYRWYNQEIGGAALDTTIGLLDGDIYFVTIVDPEGNESERRQIEVSVYDIPPPLVTRTHQVFYSNDPVTVSELVAVGNNIIWYDANGIAFDPETHLDESVTYYAGQTDLNCKEGDINCCVSTERIAVTVEILEELPPSLIGCERFRPQPGDHYVISAWVREDGLLATNPEVKPFSAVSNSFVKLLEHLYEDVLVGNKSIPAIYKVDNRQLDDLIPFIVNSVDKNLTVYNFKLYKRKQDNEGPERTVGFEFSLIPGNNAPVYRYQTPFVVENGNNQKNYRYPLSHNSEVLDLKFKDVIVTGNTLKIISDFSITGAPYSLTRTNIENNTNAAGIQSEITTFTFISDPDYQAMKYMNSSMRLIFKSGDPVASEDELEEIQNIEFTPKGALIDGWQRVSADFVIPLDAINMTISLESNIRQGSPESLNVYFDDIRIHPFEGNMKTFVYDPITQRLQAELDENNYATFYEYDQEGGLIRVKKETERGVYTIQETRSGNAKRTN
ncbi:immunoglobulin domain-containing protein [uncultured Aquimarina sp.]|uniref:immunoglobulin domain-containing protein n=1 Tax=uncultured Aquimarina sp. TaxID=575652 RepID=UPI002631899F|nr:immunoglobulin domain-containing protein [uncultured Aquimarina sp.]